MSGDERALLRAVVASPDEDAPRLVYADWLEERGDASRAAFIRVSCRAAAAVGAERDRLTAESLRIQGELAARCWGELPTLCGVAWDWLEPPHHRGFVSGAAAEYPADLAELDAACELLPVVDLQCRAWHADQVPHLALFGRLRILTFLAYSWSGEHPELEAEQLRALVRRAWPPCLRTVAVLRASLSLDHAAALASADRDRPFPFLDLGESQVSAAAASVLRDRFGDDVLLPGGPP